MFRTDRRSVLRLLGASLGGVTLGGAASGATTTATTTAYPQADEGDQRLRKLGHSLLSDPPGGYAEEDISPDGEYGVVGSYWGEGGSFLVDLSDPSNPTEVHRVPSSPGTRNADVKFDPRRDVYYRTQEPTESAGNSGVEVVSYGFGDATPENPKILAHVDVDHTHNVYPHPEEPVLYAVNSDSSTKGIDVVDVSDPANPSFVHAVGPTGGNHDVVVDAERELLHAAYISAGEFAGYMIFDVSDPKNPTPAGSFDYTTAQPYAEVGEEGFDNCHYATYDPDRMLAYVGDEVGLGVPGGKHVFDIGWGEGSVSEPVPVGFTHSPHAEPQDQPNELFDWTTHNHTAVSRPDGHFLVSGDYHEGVVLYDVTDPRNITPIDWYETDDGMAQAKPPIFPTGRPPMAWGANYHPGRELVFASDMYTGVYTFEILPDVEPGQGPPSDTPGEGPPDDKGGDQGSGGQGGSGLEAGGDQGGGGTGRLPGADGAATDRLS